MPIAGHAVIEDRTVQFEGLVASVDGTQVIRDRIEGPVDQAAPLGTALADRILSAGGRQILDRIYGRV